MGYVSAPFHNLQIPDRNANGDIPAHFLKLARSMVGKLVKRFDTVEARGAAMNAIEQDDGFDGQLEGLITYIDGKGWDGWDGVVQRTFSMRGVTFASGHANVTTNAVGLFSIPHTLGVSSVIPSLTPLYGAGQTAQLARCDLKVREFKMNEVVCWAVDSQTGQGIQNELITVAYRFEKF